MLTHSTTPTFTGCSHSCRDERGACLECGFFTGTPGVMQGPFGRFGSARALEWFLAKQSFAPLVQTFARLKPQSEGWRNIRRQCRRNAVPHIEAIAAIYD